MIKFFTRTVIILMLMFSHAGNFAQNSMLVNFGTNTCQSINTPSFSLIKDPFATSPTLLIVCDLSAQLPDIFSVFVAYNPKNNRIYIADISSEIDTKIWVLDIGLPQNITCPAAIPVAPDYSYPYISNNFEFDNNGDLWSFSNYNPATGICNMDKFDVTTGNIINTRTLQFPAGNYPTAITSGDLTILPNGRMFATLGSFPSRLYEIHNYSSTTVNATATFLNIVPFDCYGIAYINGQLEIAGTDFGGNCYYFKYDIATNALSGANTFQNGQLPIDNTSISPSLGVTKQLLSSVLINANTADLTYEIYVANLGNVALNNINVSDDLAAVYGAANISNVRLTFVPGSNNGQIKLNPFYDGKSKKNMLLPRQNLNNKTAVNNDYYFKMRISFRVTNLNPSVIYLNSAIGEATIGGSGNTAVISVADSSNNGPKGVIDPNNNGNAGDVGENVPTPFALTTLPVKFISVNARVEKENAVMVEWAVATPVSDAKKFEIEYSDDGLSWNTAGEILITDNLRSRYEFLHTALFDGTRFYRIKEMDYDGRFIYSNIVSVQQKTFHQSTIIYPVPADNELTIWFAQAYSIKKIVSIYDNVGKMVYKATHSGNRIVINTSSFAGGNYWLATDDGSGVTTSKILIAHQ